MKRRLELLIIKMLSIKFIVFVIVTICLFLKIEVTFYFAFFASTLIGVRCVEKLKIFKGPQV